MKTWFADDGETLFNLDLVKYVKMRETGLKEDTKEVLYEVVAVTDDEVFTIDTDKDWNEAQAILGAICDYLGSPKDHPFDGMETKLFRAWRKSRSYVKVTVLGPHFPRRTDCRDDII